AQTTTAAQLQLALVNIPTIGTGNVTVTGPAGGPYVVTFAAVLGNTDVDPLVVTTLDGIVDFQTVETVKGSPNAPGVLVNEIQRITNPGNAVGQYTITYKGESTPAGLLDDTSNATQVAAALNALTTISADGGFVTVKQITGTNKTFDIEFFGADNGNRD